MRVEFYNTGDSNVIKISGKIASDNYMEFSNEINSKDFGSSVIVFDFHKMNYISSAGLRVFLAFRKKYKDNTINIIGCSQTVYDIFETTGFTTYFNLQLREETVENEFASIKAIIEKKAATDSDTVFLYETNKTYTWKKVDEASSYIASELVKLGARKGSHIGICSKNCANWILTFFAVQKLGAVACLMNFSYTADEIKKVANLGDITIFCYGDCAAVRGGTDAIDSFVAGEDCSLKATFNINKAIDFNELHDANPHGDYTFHEIVEPDDVCAMIYTSGSTGIPKGVLLSSYNILNSSIAMSTGIKMNEEDKICLILPLFHIFGITAGLFCCVASGASIYIQESTKADDIFDTIYREKCTLFHSVPTVFIQMMNSPNFDSDKVDTLRCSILAGAATTEAQILEMMRLFKSNHFVNAYGLSEMAPVSLTDYEETVERITSTVGKPINNIRIIIQNTETKEECKPNEPGEILVEGFNTMAGYYKVAIDDQAVDMDGWLHTGDLGIMDEDGYLHITGRAKELIIRGGENIVPNEIAGQISAHPDVEDVKVVGVPDDIYGEAICACIRMREGCTFDEAGMKEFLIGKLAKYKMPAYYLIYESFPMLASGKADMVNLKKDAAKRCGM